MGLNHLCKISSFHHFKAFFGQKKYFKASFSNSNPEKAGRLAG